MKTKKNDILRFRIEKNIPIPAIVRTYKDVEERKEMIKATVPDMKIGLSFYIPSDRFITKSKTKNSKIENLKKGRITQVMSIVNKCKLINEKFKAEVDAKGGVRVWRIK